MPAILLLLAAIVSEPDGTAIAAQLQAGKMLCSNPDLATKTCSSIASYATDTKGVLVETSEVLIPAEQPITLELSANAEVNGATICGVMTEADLERGIVRLNGVPLPPEQHAAVLAELAAELKPMAGRRVCDDLRIENGQLMTYGQFEAVDAKLPGEPVRWIGKDEGYKVGAR